MNPGKFGLGQPVPRSEDPRFLRGGGRYTDDINLSGQAWSFLLRSPHAHARILSIDVSEALGAPGVIAIYTGADIHTDGLGIYPRSLPGWCRSRAPTVPRCTSRTILHSLSTRSRSLVIPSLLWWPRPTQQPAMRLNSSKSITNCWKQTPTLPKHCRAHLSGTNAPITYASQFKSGDKAATDAAFSRAAHISRVEIPVTRLCVNAMEPRAALGEYDPYDERYTLHCGNQFPHDIRAWLAEFVLKIPQSSLRVISPDMGGSFGLRSHIFSEIALVLWAAEKLRRPVKWRGERSEGFMEDHCRDVILDTELALSADGDFLGLRVMGTANMGAYLSNFGPLPAFGNLSGIAGTYTTPAIYAEITSVFTNTAPVHPYRGAGRPEATLAIERVIDEAARELGIDRAELRRRNLIPSSAMPYQTPLSYNYDCGDFERNMTQALALSDYAGFEARRAKARSEGKLLGYGIANAVEQAAGMFDEGAEIRFDATGVATLFIGVHSHGQGHATVFRQLVSERLGLDFENIRYIQGDTDIIPYGHGTGGSRASGLAGTALLLAADKIIEKGKLIAAHRLEAAVEDIEFTDGRFLIAGTDKQIDLDEVAKTAHTVRGLPAGVDSGLTGFATFTPPGPTYPNACHVCEVAIDPETGATEFTRYCAVEDVGTVMNPMLLKGQLHGGIVQGIGQVTLENMVFDSDAQLLSGSFMDYTMPRADDMPSFEIQSNPVPTQKNPLGIKGVGEAGTVGALAAATSAVLDALAPAGVTQLDMPATPQRIWQAISAGGR